MNKRNQTIWTLLVVLALLFIILNGFKLYPIQKKFRRIESRAQNVQIGTDKELENTIEYLEARLEDRNKYIFDLKNEPLNLQNVLYLYDAQGRRLKYKDTKKLRITAVFTGGTKPHALINYRDMNYTVAMGDSIADGEIVWIDEEEVVLSKDNKEIHYPVTVSASKNNLPSGNNN
ncbi:MAG: hypothetical protein HQ509_10650 [Candidatus Marinimicrobia bacterium]|nr:hypothetical protein [Candidatus Neomarinimicrobiota bacterium]